MKSTIITIFLIFLSAHVFAHGAPTIKEFQMFPESMVAQPVANVCGVAVAIPGVIIGGTAGLLASPFAGSVKESCFVGGMVGGMSGYMIGQQIAWPIYWIEKGIKWCFE